MRAFYIRRSGEGKSWIVVSRNADCIEVDIKRPNPHKGMIPIDAYNGVKRYPTLIPIYTKEDWVKGVLNNV